MLIPSFLCSEPEETSIAQNQVPFISAGLLGPHSPILPFCLLPLTYTGLEQRVNQREDKSFEAGSQEAFHQLEERNAIYIYSCIRLSRVSQVALVVKNLLVNEGNIRDLGLGRCPGEGNGNSLQYSCLENPMDRGAWRATDYRVAMSRTRLK